MKKVLIISPHFPPVNAADMHRVRQSLPYFKKYGWEPTVLTVAPEHVEMNKDEVLQNSIPKEIEIHRVKAFSTKYTRKLGLGNLGIRAFWQLFVKGNELIIKEYFDLIYFSTTVFASMPLGRLWKKKFNIPFIIDMQDPWRNDYYLTVPKEKRPPKFWFAHRLNKNLEAYTIPSVDGLIAVSEGYITTLRDRYQETKLVPGKVLTFGAALNDVEVAESLNLKNTFFSPSDNYINVVYVGRGGHDMKESLLTVFQAFKKGLSEDKIFKKCKFWFIGTSYAPNGEGKQTIQPLANELEIGDHVIEITDRQPYFNTLHLLTDADLLLIPGSNDSNYTASKLYPNIMAKKPIMGVFHSNSSVVEKLEDLNAGEVVLFDQPYAESICLEKMKKFFHNLPFTPGTKWEKFKKFSAEKMTEEQVDFFNLVLKNIASHE